MSCPAQLLDGSFELVQFREMLGIRWHPVVYPIGGMCWNKKDRGCDHGYTSSKACLFPPEQCFFLRFKLAR